MIKPVFLYTLGRILAFAIPLVVLWAFGVGGVLSILIALVASVPIAFLALRRQRDELTAALHDRAQRRAAERQQLRSQLRGQ